MVLLQPQGVRAANELDGQPSIRNKKRFLDGRHSLAPIIGFTVNDEYSRNVMGGLGWRYYVTGWLGVGVDLAAGIGLDTGLTDEINDELSTGGKSFQLSTSSLRFATFASVEIVPFAGKFNILGAVNGRIDFHLDMGFGVAMVSGTGRIDDSTSMLPVFGAGLRVFPTSWVGVSLDFRDLVVSRVLSSRRDGSLPAPDWTHSWLTTVSVGFYFPTEPEAQP